MNVLIKVIVVQDNQKPPTGPIQNLSNNWCFVDCKFTRSCKQWGRCIEVTAILYVFVHAYFICSFLLV